MQVETGEVAIEDGEGVRRDKAVSMLSAIAEEAIRYSNDGMGGRLLHWNYFEVITRVHLLLGWVGAIAIILRDDLAAAITPEVSNDQGRDREDNRQMD